jgi:hypothetical protein
VSESGYLPTISATDVKGRSGSGHIERHGPKRLSDAILWPTPTVNGNNNRAGLTAKSGDGLATAVKRFATPAASDATRGGTCITENMTGQSLRQQIGGRLEAPHFRPWQWTGSASGGVGMADA